MSEAARAGSSRCEMLCASRRRLSQRPAREFERAACTASLTWQPILVHTYICNMHTRVWHTYPGIDPQCLRIVEYTVYVCVAPPPKYRCRGADSSGNATFVLYIVLTRLFVRSFIFHRYRISSLNESVSRLPYRNYAKRQNTDFNDILSRLHI